LLEGYDRIPLFDGGKQQKMPFQALGRSNPALQVVDLICVRGEIRYGAEQRNFRGRTAELIGQTAEYSGICLAAGFPRPPRRPVPNA
jgi:hypothetical protein